jgi:ABC-2 type transport system ATP-binding protein
MTLKTKNSTIIYSSHFLEEAEKICTRMAIIDEGKLISEGSRAEMITAHTDCTTLESLFLKLTGKHMRD